MSLIDEYNYQNDRRVIVANASKPYSFDPDRMVVLFELEDGESPPQTHELPARYVVCDVCQGKGRHVNPSIDAGGISGEDFASWDPEERESYLSGGYDVTCFGCGGLRVSPIVDVDRLSPDQKAVFDLFMDHVRDLERYDAESRAERAMGA